jgi:hypothetical protein
MPTLHRRAAAALFALTAAAVLGDATTAKAGLLASATRTALISGGGAAVFLPLTDNNSVTTLTFSTTAPNETVVFRYNAECEASTPGWVSVGIFVDGTQTYPQSFGDFMMCSSSGGGANIYTGALRQSVYTVPTAGIHTVSVKAVSEYGNDHWLLDDTCLTVEN